MEANEMDQRLELDAEMQRLRAVNVHLTDQVRGLLEAGLSLTQEHDLDSLLMKFVDVARSLTGARYGALGVIDPDKRLEKFLHSGMTDEQLARLDAPPHGGGVLGTVLQGHPIRVPDIMQHPDSVGFPPDHPPMRSFLGVPVLAQGKVFGNLYLTEKAGNAEFTVEDEEMMVTLAGFAGVAVQNAQLINSLDQKQHETQTLYDLGQGISRSLDLEAIFGVVVQAAASILGAEKAHLMNVDQVSGMLRPAALHGFTSDQVSIRIGEGVLGRAAQDGVAVVIPDVEAEQGTTFLLSEGVRSCAIAPVRISGQMYGILGVHYAAVNAVPESALTILKGLADQASIAILNAELYRDASMERRSLGALFESLVDGVYTLDPERYVTRINGQAARMASMTPFGAIGLHCQKLFQYWDGSGQNVCMTSCPSLHALETGEAVPARECSFVDSNDEEIPVLLSASPIRERDGQVVGVVEVVQDMRHKKEIDELRDSIVSLASHELRSPLTTIKGFANTLLQTDVEWDEETRRDFLESIEEEADRLAALVTNLLDLSRIESRSALDVTHVPVPPEVLISQGIHATAGLVDADAVTVEVMGEVPDVLADPRQVERVIVNLMENAVKYGMEGEHPAVRVRERDGLIQFDVEDHGAGVPAGEREKVFEKFTRLSNHGRRATGAGLGLALCKTIVERNGGRIWVSETPGGGATFSFTLPVAVDSSQR